MEICRCCFFFNRTGVVTTKDLFVLEWKRIFSLIFVTASGSNFSTSPFCLFFFSLSFLLALDFIHNKIFHDILCQKII